MFLQEEEEKDMLTETFGGLLLIWRQNILNKKGGNLNIRVTARLLEILLIFHLFFIKHKTTETPR